MGTLVLVEEYNVREPAGDGSLMGWGERELAAGMSRGEGEALALFWLEGGQTTSGAPIGASNGLQ